MATQTLLIDDLDGSTENVDTVHFSVGNNSYQIDLNPKNQEKLDKALAPFVERAARVNTRGSAAKRQSIPAREIREWAKTQDENISSLLTSDRGPLPKALISVYNDIHGTKY